MNLKKLIISGVLSIGIILGGTSISAAQTINYNVKGGDTFWLISQRYGVPLNNLMELNKAKENTILYVGQNISIPTQYGIVHSVKAGDTFWIISQKYKVGLKSLMEYNNANDKTIIYVGQKIKIPSNSSSTFNATLPVPIQSPSNSKPYITFTQYVVKKGDTLWDTAIKFGIPQIELLKANNLNESSYLNIGDTLKIPLHHIPVKSTPGEKYGEYLDWWTEAQYVIPVGGVFEVIDFSTGKSFKAKRTTGANHADCEALSLADTNIMKQIWGGNLNWTTRPVIIKYNGRKLAASASSLPHAGNDNAPGGLYTTWRSNNYGPGYNLDWVKNNGMDGVFDIHFLNSTRHKDGKVDLLHQDSIKTAAGIK